MVDINKNQNSEKRRFNMPTFNQLVRNGREKKEYKSKAPVLQKGFNHKTADQSKLSTKERRLHQGLYDYAEETELRSP